MQSKYFDSLRREMQSGEGVKAKRRDRTGWTSTSFAVTYGLIEKKMPGKK